jgi:hypothetical protein
MLRVGRRSQDARHQTDRPNGAICVGCQEMPAWMEVAIGECMADRLKLRGCYYGAGWVGAVCGAHTGPRTSRHHISQGCQPAWLRSEPAEFRTRGIKPGMQIGGPRCRGGRTQRVPNRSSVGQTSCEDKKATTIVLSSPGSKARFPRSTSKLRIAVRRHYGWQRIASERPGPVRRSPGR